jgi:TPR repeat protein
MSLKLPGCSNCPPVRDMPPGQYNLALYYEQGRGGIARDDAEAARLLKLAADQGDISAQKELAELDKRQPK